MYKSLIVLTFFASCSLCFLSFKTLPSLRSKMSPEITSNDPRVLILHVQRNISSFNLSTGTNILVFCTERQSRKIHVLDATHSRPQSHSTTWPRNDGLWGREWTRRADVLTLANTRTTAWACATFLLFEYLLPVASYSRRVSDLTVTLKTKNSDKLKLTYRKIPKISPSTYKLLQI